MRRLRTLAPLLLLLLGMAAGCTGTSENVPPLLLAVGRQDPTNPSASQMVLVEDNFTTNQATARTLTVVPGSARPLPYPAVASDVVDRAGTRSSMVVLTRELPGGTSPSSALVTFNLVGIDPGAPTAFVKQSTTPLTGASGDPLQADAPVCPTGVTVSATGRYVTILDDPRACNDTSRFPRLFQLDTRTGNAQPVVLSSGVQVTQPTVPVDDQIAPGETLYFLVPGTNDAQVWADAVPHDASLAKTVASLPGRDQIALATNGTDLMAVTNPYPYTSGTYAQSYVQTVTPGLLAPAGKQIDTVSGANAAAIDPSGATSQVVVAGHNASGSGQIAVHPDASTKATATTPYYAGYTGVAAAIDPGNRFGYVVDNERIVVLDLLTVTSQQTGWYKAFDFSSTTDLALPKDAADRYDTALAWTRAKPTPP